MELTRQKYGYRLQIGGHDIFLTERSIAELQQLIGGTRPVSDEYRWLTYDDLDQVTANNPLTLLLAPGQVQYVRSKIHLYLKRSGRSLKVRVLDEAYVRERRNEVRRYVVTVR